MTSDDNPNQFSTSKIDDVEHLLLTHVQQIVNELNRGRTSSQLVRLDSQLERELALDSLGRAELISRLEHAFDVRLSDQILSTAETPRDLLGALQRSDLPRLGAKTFSTSQIYHDGIDVNIPVQARTLTDVLEWHASTHPERPHVHLHTDDDQVEVITYASLYNKSLKIAAGLQEMELKPGQTVAMMLPTSEDFLVCFYGILFAGGVPVPIYPPTRPSQLQDHLKRQVGILNNAQSPILITIPEARKLAYLVKALASDLQRVVTPMELVGGNGRYQQANIQTEDMALIQYTSGSTGTPKGVVLTHANLLSNIRAMNQVVNTTPSDVFVSWLPLYHDMGLIGAWLGSVYCAYQLVLMSPLAFLSRPARWLWAIHHYGGTISGAPNFAYGLCLNKIDSADVNGLDLSSWRLAFNGAEAINSHTMAAFKERFATYRFRPDALLPVYGLAENTLGLAFSPLNRAARIDYIQREPFGRLAQAIPVDDDKSDALSFVSCGFPLLGHQIRIVDDLGLEAPERQVGRLEFRGPSATGGYFRNSKATYELFNDGWLVSGDLAYIAEGEVFITGRHKDLIIRAGRNLYPHELEDALGDVEGIRKGCVAVFGSTEATAETERLVVVAETRETEPARQAILRSKINSVAVDILGTPPDDIVLAPPSAVLKTSSGKIRRSATRDLYESNKLGGAQGAVWLQVARLALSAWWPQLQRLRRNLNQVVYAGYVWCVFCLLAPIAWLAILSTPSRVRRQDVIRKLTRLAFRLNGIPIQVQGLEHIPEGGPYVLVVNHASYLDALLLIAVMPLGLKFVAKQELYRNVFSRIPMQRLGVEFVERFDATRGVEDMTRIAKMVRQGEPVLFFPEGTFHRNPGLQPFRMGAFAVAAQAGALVIPAAIRGTRSMLRAGQWFPRWGRLSVVVGQPIKPTDGDWSSTVMLCNAARRQILEICGEPDLQ
ncbi:MAG: AMP-binding protein [bacterium]|nr:AMP-binding protein [bacterium]